jgi:hypothetical protein
MASISSSTPSRSVPNASIEIQIKKTLLYSVYCTGQGEDNQRTDVDDDFIPDNNADYKDKGYWDFRFARERSYEWLGTFAVVKAGMEKTGIDFSASNKRVLVVGCGNSSFSKDLSLSCPSWTIVSIDFSPIVIANMRRQHPELVWVEEDMTKMSSLESDSFDYVLDKAAMDALVADEGRSWYPSESSKKSVDDMVKSSCRVLKSGAGRFSIVSFQPVHFRRRHLERAILNTNSQQDSAIGRWTSDFKVANCENPQLGTEFAVYTLTKL